MAALTAIISTRPRESSNDIMGRGCRGIIPGFGRGRFKIILYPLAEIIYMVVIFIDPTGNRYYRGHIYTPPGRRIL